MTINDDSNDWINVVQNHHKCPNCETGYLNNRVKRGFFVKYVFLWMDVKRYECGYCGKKTYVKNTENEFEINSK